MEEENKGYIIHKVQAGYNYVVYRSENNGRIFHKIGIEQKLPDGQKMRAYLSVRFKDGVDIPDKTRIKIKKGIENFYFSKNDSRHYNPIFYIQILEFENLDITAQEYTDAVINNDVDDLGF